MVNPLRTGLFLLAFTFAISSISFSQTKYSRRSLQTSIPYLHAPSVYTYARQNPNGLTILPNGRFIKPVGLHFPVTKWPTGLALSPDDSRIFVTGDSMGQLFMNWRVRHPVVVSLAPCAQPPEDTHYTEGDPVFSKDGRTIYWSSGDKGGVYCINVRTRSLETDIPLNVETEGRKFEDSFVMAIKLSEDGHYLYCADVTNFRVAIIDIAQRKVVGSVDVGRYPYALAVSGHNVYVANIGMFEYSAISAPTKPGFDPRGLTFPPFGEPSLEARNGVEREGRWVPGLGDPNVPASFSVWGIDASDPLHPHVVSRRKTGLLVGASSDNGTTVGGSAPNFLAVHGNRLYISDNNDDIIEGIDLSTGKRVMWTPIHPSPLVANLRGVQPSGMAVSPDGGRLYVAESGINAIGVIDTHTGRVMGHIPTAWYPYRVAISKDGAKLICICFRGFGFGPRGVKRLPDDPFLGTDDANGAGVLCILNVPSKAELVKMTADTLAYNGIVDKSADRKAMSSPIIPGIPGHPSPDIKYVVFIAKENHTFDTIFDHVPGANSDPKLLRWGLHQTISAPGEPTLHNAAVMTNHNALARQFCVSDNYYVEPEASGVGHRWLVDAKPNNFCQMTYTLRWDFRLNSTAPGRRASFGGNGSIAPEDYPEAGTLWDQLARHGVSFRNYGEGFEFAGVYEDEGEHKTGAREVVNIPMEKVLYDNTCREFPIFNMNIPDQYRAYWFEQDFNKRYVTEKLKMPSFTYIALCNDHGTDPSPAHGYPYVASWMADDDLALGRIVDFLSHTKYWKNMAIFVTEDDAGSENDHIDAQRSVLLVISPWAKRHYVSHRHTTIVSIHRMIYEILGLPPLNMQDALANDFSDCFTTHPNFTPYNHVPVDPRIFDPEKAKDPNDPNYRMARKEVSIRRDDPAVEARVLQNK